MSPVSVEMLSRLGACNCGQSSAWDEFKPIRITTVANAILPSVGMVISFLLH
jgi:hypothetical protein